MIHVNENELPEVQSYSAIRNWMTCQLRYWMTKVERNHKRGASWASVGGRAVHTLTHEWELEFSRSQKGDPPVTEVPA